MFYKTIFRDVYFVILSDATIRIVLNRLNENQKNYITKQSTYNTILKGLFRFLQLKKFYQIN